MLKSAANICQTLLTNLSMKANSVYPDQTAPTGAVCSGSTLFVKGALNRFQQMKNQVTFDCFLFVLVFYVPS